MESGISYQSVTLQMRQYALKVAWLLWLAELSYAVQCPFPVQQTLKAQDFFILTKWNALVVSIHMFPFPLCILLDN